MVRGRAVSTLNAIVNSVTFKMIAAAVARTRNPAPGLAPQAPAAAPSAVSTVVTTTLAPPATRSSRLRRRALTGFGRELRGTPRTLFSTVWTAWTMPRPP
jgi:hypothetical protein